MSERSACWVDHEKVYFCNHCVGQVNISNMLKQASDGLSKVWKVHKSHDPYYSGGKVRKLHLAILLSITVLVMHSSSG